jgi:hypothetical protein
MLVKKVNTSCWVVDITLAKAHATIVPVSNAADIIVNRIIKFYPVDTRLVWMRIIALVQPVENMLVWASIRNSIAGIGAVKAETIVCVGLAVNTSVKGIIARLFAICTLLVKAEITSFCRADIMPAKRASTTNTAYIADSIFATAAITMR